MTNLLATLCSGTTMAIDLHATTDADAIATAYANPGQPVYSWESGDFFEAPPLINCPHAYPACPRCLREQPNAVYNVRVARQDLGYRENAW